MDTEIRFQNISNLTTSTGGYGNGSTTPTDNDGLERILSYAIPLSCAAIVLVLFVVIGVRQRHHVLEKWTSLKRMKNTNSRFRQSIVLRRDSEFDSYDQEDVKSTGINQGYSLTTVS